KGFVRVIFKGSMQKVESLLEDKDVPNKQVKEGEVEIVIDRIRLDKEEDTIHRIADSVQTAFFEGKGTCAIEIDRKRLSFSDKFELDGITFEIPTANFFSF